MNECFLLLFLPLSLLFLLPPAPLLSKTLVLPSSPSSLSPSSSAAPLQHPRSHRQARQWQNLHDFLDRPKSKEILQQFRYRPNPAPSSESEKCKEYVRLAESSAFPGKGLLGLILTSPPEEKL